MTKFERVLEQKQKLISLRKRTIGNREIIQRINVFQVYQKRHWQVISSIQKQGEQLPSNLYQWYLWWITTIHLLQELPLLSILKLTLGIYFLLLYCKSIRILDERLPAKFPKRVIKLAHKNFAKRTKFAHLRSP